MMNRQFENKIVLVTGASRGVGFATAKLFAQQGASVFMCSRNQTEIEAAANKISKEINANVYPLKADVSNASDVKMLFDMILEKAGRLDICINNAGYLQLKPFIELSEQEWDKSLNINLRSVFLCSQAAFKLMSQSQDRNFIININSLSGMQSVEKFAGMSAYIASKSAMTGLTEALAVEGKAYNIHVNAIAPGAIATQMFEENFASAGFSAGAKPDNIAKMILALCDPDGLGLTSGTLIPIYCNA